MEIINKVKIQKEGNGICLPIPNNILAYSTSGSVPPRYTIGSTQSPCEGNPIFYLDPSPYGETILKERWNRTKTAYIPTTWIRWLKIQSGTYVELSVSGPMLPAGENSFAKMILAKVLTY